MFGRLRTFRHLGGEVRGEWANQNLLGFKQDFQAGIRYEYQDMTNKNVLGRAARFWRTGTRASRRSSTARSTPTPCRPSCRPTSTWRTTSTCCRASASNGSTSVARTVSSPPRKARPSDRCDPCTAHPLLDECRRIEDSISTPTPRATSTSSFNALPGVAFAYTGLYRITVYGGYHRGLTTNVLRNEDFPSPDEIGDNFNVGLRSSAIKGFDFEVAGFYQPSQDFQYGELFSAITGDREFGRADEVDDQRRRALRAPQLAAVHRRSAQLLRRGQLHLRPQRP